jgi:hypothetical protein
MKGSKPRPCSSGKYRGNPLLARIVGDLHVGTPDTEAIERVRSRLRAGAWAAMTAQQQRWFKCEVLRVHHDNLSLYRDVMGGRL